MSVREDEEPPRFTDRRSSAGRGPEEAGGQEENERETQGEGPDKESVTQENSTELEDQLAREQEKAQSYYASWQRAAADYQNLKRRVDQERSEVTQMANASIMINLLPLVDDLERALENVDSHLAGLTWLDGIRLIHRKFQALLEMYGVTEIPAESQDFDSNVHEAIMYGDGEDGKVINVAQKGYMLGGRVLRPAMVVVGKGGEQQSEQEGGEQDGS